jgi:hypothetical protein
VVATCWAIACQENRLRAKASPAAARLDRAPGMVNAESNMSVRECSSSGWASQPSGRVTDALGQQAVLRAVENGMSVVRPTRRGTSLAVDYQGRVLGYDASWFTSDGRTADHTLAVTVPIHGAATPQARFFGDVVGWLSIAGLLGVSIVVAVRRWASRRATRAARELIGTS